jgi:hypothetical protein
MLDPKCRSSGSTTLADRRWRPPTGQGADAVRSIRDDIDKRVRELLAELGVTGSWA